MPTIAEKYGLVKPPQTIAEKYGLTRPQPTTSFLSGAGATAVDVAKQIPTGLAQGLIDIPVSAASLLALGAQKAGLTRRTDEEFRQGVAALQEKTRIRPPAETRVGGIAGGLAEFITPTGIAGALIKAPVRAALKQTSKAGLRGGKRRVAEGAVTTGGAFAGGETALLGAPLAAGQITPEEFAKDVAASAATGGAIGAVGRLIPGTSRLARTGRFGAETGVFAEAQALREGEISPSLDQIAIAAATLGGLKGFNAALGYAARKVGTTPQEMRQRVGTDKEALVGEIEATRGLGGASELQQRISERGTLFHTTETKGAERILKTGAIIPGTETGNLGLESKVSLTRNPLIATEIFGKGEGGALGGQGKKGVRVVFETKAGMVAEREPVSIPPSRTGVKKEAEVLVDRVPVSAIKTIFTDDANIAKLAQEKGIQVRPLSEATTARLQKGADIGITRTPQEAQKAEKIVPPTPSAPERIAPPDVIKARVGGEVAERAGKALREGDTKTYQEEIKKLSPADQFGVHISKEELLRERIGVKERAESVYTAIKDKFRPIQRFAQDVSGDKPLKITEDPFLLHRLSVGWRGKPETFIERGTFSFKEGPGKLSGKGLINIWRPIKDKRSEYSNYILAKAAEGRERAGKTTGVRPDLSVEERINLSKQAIAELEAQHPEFAKVFEEQKQWQDAVVRYATEAELIAPETAALWKKVYENYTPMHRVVDTPGIDLLSKGHGDVFQPFKRAKGSEKLIIDPMETTIKNVYAIMAAAERNANALSVVNLAGRPNGERWVKKVKAPLRPVAQVDLKEIAQKLKVSPEELQELGVTKDLITIFRPDSFVPKGKNIIQVRRKGKVELYELEPTLFRAMSTLDAPSMGAVGKIMSFPTKLLRAGAVLSPDFIFGRNPVRDQFTAFLFSKYNFIPGIDLGRGLFHYLGATDTYFRWKASGGPHSTLVSLDRNYLQHNLKDMYASRISQIPKVFTHPIEALRALSEALETGTRLGEFALAQRAEGLSKAGLQKGAFASKEVTLDFSRIGTTGRALNSIIAFWNAQLEGIDKLGREFRARPGGLTTKLVAGITLPSVLLWFANRDDEEIQNLAAWRKDLFWNFRVGGVIASLPKPFEPGILFGTTAEKILDWTLENDPDAIKKAGDAILRGATPDIIPTAFRPFVEQVANRNLFFDRPIVPRGQEKLEPFLQSNSFSSRVSKLIGETLNISPARIDAFIRGTTGGLGRLGVSGIDIGLGILGVGAEDPSRPAGGLSDIPIIRAYVARNPSAQTSSLEDFYDKFNRAVTVRATLRKLIEQRKVEDSQRYAKENKDSIVNYSVLNGINTQLKQHRKIMRRIMQSKLTPQQKREKLNKVMSQMGHLTFTLMKKLRERR